MSGRLKVWFLETRPQFLILCAMLAFLGTTAAWYDHIEGSIFAIPFSPGLAVLGFIGLLLTHISVNTLNDYFDFKSGIDLAVQRTPFSGGSGILPAAGLTSGQVLGMGVTSLVLASFIGIYFLIYSGLGLLPLLVIAAACVVLYTPFILKTHWPEWAAGLGLGLLPILGIYFIQTSSYTLSALFAAMPAFFLVHNLLLLNEFPDVNADKIDNRRTLPIAMGKKKAGIVFSAAAIAVYVWIIIGIVLGQMPIFTLLAFLTLPFAMKAINGALHPDDMSKLMPGMANNVIMVLTVQLLMGAGYLLGAIL